MDIRSVFRIISPGPLTTVQDLGRFGYARLGVAPSGALDFFSLRIGNLLVGNRENTAGLEVTLGGLKMEALEDVRVAVTGGQLNPSHNGSPLIMWRSHVFRQGDVLAFGAPQSGCRACLAVGGGICVDAVMGSKSTNLPSRFGGFEGRSLQKGDILRADSPAGYLKAKTLSLSRRAIPTYDSPWNLRVIPGPHDHHFSKSSRDRFFNHSFLTTPHADRTGIRLSGPKISAKRGLAASIVSEGVISGAIQIPGDDQPIILLNETVTGGYRKIATVIEADRFLLGQIKPGDRINFMEVTREEACDALRGLEAIFDGLRAKMRALGRT
jgi:antagonist of KipI